MTNRTFTAAHASIARAFYANVSHQRRPRGPRFDRKYNDTTIDYLVKDLKVAYEKMFGLDNEETLMVWAAEVSEIIGDGASFEARKTIEETRKELEEYIADVIDEREQMKRCLEPFELAEEYDRLRRFLATSETVGDFWFWFCSYYVEEAIIEMVRDDALAILSGSTRSVTDVAQEALEAWGRAWIRFDKLRQEGERDDFDFVEE